VADIVARYMRKVNYVEAVRWTGDNRTEIDEFTQSNPGEIFWDFIDGISIKTPNGRVTAKKGDWICKDMMGKLYPCSDDVFRQTYHVEDDD
jgi:hypothetical protein